MSPTVDALSAYFPDGKFFRRVHALPEYGCIYVRNAKVATSTTVLWLHRIHTGDHGFTPVRNIHREHALPRPGSDIAVEHLARMLSGDAFRFAFVRHPVRRIESAYMDKIADPAKLRFRAQVRRALGQPPGPDAPVALEEFVTALESQSPIAMDAHWRPQHLNLMHPVVDYDVIGRLETFDVDLARIREMACLPDIPISVRNVAPAGPRTSLFDGRPDLLRRVRQFYAADFEIYHYE